MRNFIKNNLAVMLFTFLFLFMIIITIIGSSFKLDNTLLIANRARDYSVGWYMEENNLKVPLLEVSRPAAQKVGKVFTIYHQLPSNLSEDSTICITTKNEIVEAYVNDQLIYQYLVNNEIPYKTEVGAIRNIIHLPSTSEGKTIKIVLTPQYGANGEAPYEILLGDHNSVILSLIMNSLPKICCAIILIIITIIIIALAIAYLINGNKNSAFRNIYFGLFSLISTIWYITDGLLLQFVFTNKMISFLLFNCSFLLIPIPFALFIGAFKPTYKKLFDYIAIGLGLYFILRMVLYFTGVINFEYALFIIHLLIGGTIGCAFYVCFKERQDRSTYLMMIPILILGLNSLISLVIFYTTNRLVYNRYNYSSYFFIGIIVFAIFNLIYEMKKSKEIQRMLAQTRYFRMCAFVDNLTSRGNRAAYERDIDKYEESKDTKEVGILMIDLNNLKETNDRLGHAIGDELIINTCNYLFKAFGRIGNVYRIGGDEIAVVIVNHQDDEILQAISNFRKYINQHNLNSDVIIDYAIGYAFTDNIKNNEGKIRLLMRIADTKMYADKVHRKR